MLQPGEVRDIQRSLFGGSVTLMLLLSGLAWSAPEMIPEVDLQVVGRTAPEIELSLIDIARDIAKKMDTVTRDTISGTGAAISASTNVGTTILKPADIINAVVTLESADNPRPADNHFPTIIHPKTVYDIQTNLSGGAWLDVTKYHDGNDRIYLGEVGRMYGARFVTSSTADNLSPYFAGKPPVTRFTSATASGLNILTTPYKR